MSQMTGKKWIPELLLSELKNKPTLLQSQFVGQDDVGCFKDME